MDPDRRLPQSDSEQLHPPGECQAEGEDNDRGLLFIRESFFFCLPNFKKRRTSKAMPQGDPLSHIRNMKGMAEKLPLIRLKHLHSKRYCPHATGNPLVVRSLGENDTRQRTEPIRINEPYRESELRNRSDGVLCIGHP